MRWSASNVRDYIILGANIDCTRYNQLLLYILGTMNIFGANINCTRYNQYLLLKYVQNPHI